MRINSHLSLIISTMLIKLGYINKGAVCRFMHVNNSIILITSAGSLLGGALAERFCVLGARVILVDHCHTSLKETYQRCTLISKEEVVYLCINDYSLPSIESVFLFIDEHYQQAPDALINLWPNPDIPSITEEHPIERFSSHISSMTTTLFSFVQLCAQRMRNDEKKGVVINIILDTNEKIQNRVDHTSSIISGFTQSWAKELTPFNIRVGGIIPNAIDHEPMNKLLYDAIKNTEYILENEYFSGRVMSS